MLVCMHCRDIPAFVPAFVLAKDVLPTTEYLLWDPFKRRRNKGAGHSMGRGRGGGRGKEGKGKGKGKGKGRGGASDSAAGHSGKGGAAGIGPFWGDSSGSGDGLLDMDSALPPLAIEDGVVYECDPLEHDEAEVKDPDEDGTGEAEAAHEEAAKEEESSLNDFNKEVTEMLETPTYLMGGNCVLSGAMIRRNCVSCWHCFHS